MLQSPRENKAPKEHLTKDPKIHNIKKNEAKTFRKKKIIHYDFTAVITNPASYYRSHGSIKTFDTLPVDHINCHALKNLGSVRQVTFQHITKVRVVHDIHLHHGQTTIEKTNHTDELAY